MPHDPSLFEGAAYFYARYRPPYARDVIDVLCNHFRLCQTTHVLDLGCGTGQLAIPLANREIPVHAVDPDLDMLAEGTRLANVAGVYNIAWQVGDDACIDRLQLPPLKLAAMGASFHWMNREKVLNVLDRLVQSDGGVAVLSGGSVWSEPGPSWTEVIKQVVLEFLGPERRAGSGTYQHPSERHEAILAKSPFHVVENIKVTVIEEKSVDDIIGMQLATSYASPKQLGDRVDEFRRVLRKRLLELQPFGVFRYETNIEVLMGMRGAFAS